MRRKIWTKINIEINAITRRIALHPSIYPSIPHQLACVMGMIGALSLKALALAIIVSLSAFFPRAISPYITATANTIPHPNKVLIEKHSTTGISAIPAKIKAFLRYVCCFAKLDIGCVYRKCWQQNGTSNSNTKNANNICITPATMQRGVTDIIDHTPNIRHITAAIAAKALTTLRHHQDTSTSDCWSCVDTSGSEFPFIIFPLSCNLDIFYYGFPSESARVPSNMLLFLVCFFKIEILRCLRWYLKGINQTNQLTYY